MNKYYTLYGCVGGKDFKINKQFKSRDKAIAYALMMLPLDAQVQEEIELKANVIEYKCNQYNRFTVAKLA
jgi:hypothetical protein